MSSEMCFAFEMGYSQLHGSVAELNLMHTVLVKSGIASKHICVLAKLLKMATLEATTCASGTWVDCLKQCLLEVGWTDVSMTDVSSEMSGKEVEEMLTSSAWRVVLEDLHAHILLTPKLNILWLPYF